MKDSLYHTIEKSTAHRSSRDGVKNLILEDPKLLNELLQIAFNTSDKNHPKACWALELICEEKIEIFIPYLDIFCDSIHLISNESALRSISKICLFLSTNKKIARTPIQEEKIIECCFDCLINTEKAANAAYSMRALYSLSQKQDWIKDELKAILTRDISDKTPGYCFAVKDLLKRLK